MKITMMAAGSRAVFRAHIVGSIPTVIFIFELWDSNLSAGLHAPFYVLILSRNNATFVLSLSGMEEKHILSVVSVMNFLKDS